MIKHLLWTNKIVLAICQELQAGRPVISTTDTILGLLAPCTKQGFESLDQIKGRQEKPYLVLVADLAMAQSLVAEFCHERLNAIASACWPGPVTCIFPAHTGVPVFMQSAQRAIGIRVPRHEGLLQVLQCTGPLFSTSANRAGDPVPSDISNINPLLLEHITYLVTEEDSQAQSLAVASTILDCTQGQVRLIREGALSVDEIEKKAQLTIKR